MIGIRCSINAINERKWSDSDRDRELEVEVEVEAEAIVEILNGWEQNGWFCFFQFISLFKKLMNYILLVL